MIWKISPIDDYINEIKTLFLQNINHKHADNYMKHPLFEHTKFARMGFDNGNLVYYSAAVERQEYNGSIRVMTRHTRDVDYDFGSWNDDLTRGTETLDLLTNKCLSMGYSNIWFSREESPKMLEIFQKRSVYKWSINYEKLPIGGIQWVLRLTSTA